MNQRIFWIAALLFLSYLSFAQEGVIRAVNYTGYGIENKLIGIQKIPEGYLAVGSATYTGDWTREGTQFIKFDTAFNEISRVYTGADISTLTSDGGFITARALRDETHNWTDDYCVSKFGANGVLQWRKYLGGFAQDRPTSIYQLSNGNFLVSGLTQSTNGDVVGKTTTDSDIWLIEVNSSGQIVRQKIIGGSGDETGSGAFPVADGIMLYGGTYSTDNIGSGNHGAVDIILIKLDNNWNLQWNKIFGGNGGEGIGGIDVSQAGEIIIGGNTSSTNGDFPGSGTYPDGFIARISKSGNLLWSKMVSGTYYDEIRGVTFLNNGNIAATGYTFSGEVLELSFPSNHGGGDALLFMLNPNGETIWTKSIGSTSVEQGFGITEAYNGNLVVAGMDYFQSNNGDFTGVPRVLPGESMGFLMEIRSSMNVIKGSLYFDNNNNNVKDAGENYYLSSYGRIDANKGNYLITQTPIGGKFLMSTDTGVYTTFLNQNLAYDLNTNLYGFSPKKKISSFSGFTGNDSFDFRIVPISLVKDLAVTITPKSDVFLNNSIRYQIKLENLGNASPDTALLTLKFDSNIVFQSADKLPYLIDSDSVTWKFLNVGAKFRDSLILFTRVKNAPITSIGKIISLSAKVEPYYSDFDTLDNRNLTSGKIKGQNDAISNFAMNVSVKDSARVNRPIEHTIVYGFNHLLDSLTGTVKVVKDKLSVFESAFPLPISIIGDTITWKFKDLAYFNTDTIKVILRVKDSATIANGTLVSQKFKIELSTADTSVLAIEKTVNQTINGYYVQPDFTHPELAYPNGIKWTRNLGGLREDQINAIVPLQDSGYLVVGFTNSDEGDIAINADSIDGFVTRFDKNGMIKWSKTYGGNKEDRLNNVIQLKDGNFVACGTSEINYIPGIKGGLEAWIVKFDGNGDTLWTRKYGSQLSEIFNDVRELRDGGLVFAGRTDGGGGDVVGFISNPYSYYNAWVVKTNNLGIINWQRCLADSGSYSAKAIELTADNKIVVGGVNYMPYYIKTNGGHNVGFATMLDTNGVKIWSKEFGYLQAPSEVNDIVANKDSSLTFVGYKGSWDMDTSYIGGHGGIDLWLGRLDKNGKTVWEKFFGGTQPDFGTALSKTINDHFLVVGYVLSNNGNLTVHHGGTNVYDAWAFEMDLNGNLLWQEAIGGDNADYFTGVTKLLGGDVIAIGYTWSDQSGDIHNSHGGKDGLLARIGISNLITGKVYFDKNGNGFQDTDDPAFSNGSIQIGNPGFISATNIKDGNYKISADIGQYIVTLKTTDSGYYTIIPTTDTASFLSSPQSKNIDFRFVKKSSINDLRVEVLPLSTPRPGFNLDYLVKYDNKGTTDLTNVKIQFVIDAKTQLLTTTPVYSQTVGDTIAWIIPQLKSLESGTIGIGLKLYPPPIANFGQAVGVTAIINPLEGDSVPVNNINTVIQQIRGAYDPNDKVELHNGKITPQMIEGNEYLTYLIRFQNTGNDTAFNVFIRDTLDKKLDWSSLEIIASSHAYELKIVEQNKLEWEFRNVLLPDSNINEPLSHGFISFRIKLKRGAQLGDTAKNTASIYFDFNPPVATNTVTTAVVNDLSTSCPGGSIMIMSRFHGSSYHWQLDTGSGFNDIEDNSTHTGSANDTLYITGASSNWYGYKYRCRIVTNNGIILSPVYTLKLQNVWKGTVNKLWENPANWNCGILPDENTDVVIEGSLNNYPELNSNVTIRSLLIKPGASVTVKAGMGIILKGK